MATTEQKLTLEEMIALRMNQLDRELAKVPNVLKGTALEIYKLGIQAGILIQRNLDK